MKNNNHNQPEPGKLYALTGAAGAKCISNGFSWKDSEVKRAEAMPPCRHNYCDDDASCIACGAKL